MLGLCLAAEVAEAQQPTVSRPLDALLSRDTLVTVWLFVRPGRELASVALQVEQLGGRVRRRSRWLHAISAELPTGAVRGLRSEPRLRHLQLVARYRRSPIPLVPQPVTDPAAPRTAQDSLYGPSAMPLRRLNLFPLVHRGFRGAGVRIAMLDTGFETELPAFASARIAAQFDFVFNDSIVRNESNDHPAASSHGTSTWSLLAANVPGSLIGIAPDADFLLAKTEDIRTETAVEEDNYVAALEWADSLGATVVSASLGYRTFDGGTGYTFAQLTGDIAVTTVAADIAAQRGIAVVVSMGNDGPQPRTLSSPADGDSVISIAAEDSLGVLAGFSSRGPTADGRIKPDFSAPGVSIQALTAGGSFARFSGTSASTPIVAGAVALMRQIHPRYNPIGIRDALRSAGSTRDAPDNNFGWGRPDVLAAATFPRGVVVVAPADTALTSITPEFTWDAADVPLFALPVSYRLRVASDTTFATLLLDTTVSQTSVTLPRPQAPGSRFVFDLTAVAFDSAQITIVETRPYVVPPWVRLLTLDNPAGVTIRELRPAFRWAPAQVTTPPGPFVYSVTILRGDPGIAEISAGGITDTTYTPPRDLERNTPYRWSVTAHLGSDSTIVTSRGTFVITDDTAPSVTLLFQNFPNPFPNLETGQTRTCLWFDLAVPGSVRLEVLDLRGHVVRLLVPSPTFPSTLRPARYGRPSPDGPGGCDPALEWDGTASDGSIVSPGVYMAKLQTPAGVFFKRMVFLGPRD